MRFLLTVSLSLAILIGVIVPGRTQPARPITFELDFDLRSLIGSGKPTAGIYDSSLRSYTGLVPGLDVVIYGERKSPSLLAGASSGNIVLQQATVEKDWGAQRLQLGMIRLPFGIYDSRETYASGLIDYPMARVDYGLNSVDWGVPGLKWTGGTSRFQLEAAAFGGQAAGVWSNINNLAGGSVRAQAYIGDLILGASYWNGYLDVPAGGANAYGSSITNGQFTGTLTRGAVRETGLDIRFTRPQLVMRGEFLFGTLAGDSMQGGYLDLYYHLPKYYRWTLVGRVEALRPVAGVPYGRQLTLGVRYTATSNWIFAVNWRRNNGAAYSSSYTPPALGAGSLYVQAYYRLRL